MTSPLPAAGPVPGTAPAGRQIGRIASIPIRISAGSLIVALWLALLYSNILRFRFPDLGTARWPLAMLVPALLALSVLLHEAAHAAAGRWCGLRVRWIVLDWLGGETEFDRDTATPGASALVAAAGPAASLIVAVMFGAGGVIALPAPVGFILVQVAFGNAVLAAFNLLPGLPLDGGHLVRAAIWKLSGNPRAATTIAATLGLLTAVSLIVAPVALVLRDGGRPSVFGLAILVLIAAPVAHGAWSSLRDDRGPQAAELTAAQLSRPALVILPALSVHEGLRQLTARGVTALVVSDDVGPALGVLDETHLASVPPSERHLLPLGALLSRSNASPVLPADLSGEPLAAAIDQHRAPVYLVDNQGRHPHRVLFAADVPAPADR